MAEAPEICVRIDEFTDPICPWAYSTEPSRRRLRWLYEGRIEWVPRMVVLATDREAQAERGFDPGKVAKQHRRIAREHRMPIVGGERQYVAGSGEACEAVVAAREQGSTRHARMLLRRLRVAHFSGEMIDRADVIAAAAERAGIDADELSDWREREGTAEALAADVDAARQPSQAAQVLNDKLANWSGGRRYTCPSYEITRLSDDVTITVPGFQPFAVYDTILANLVPRLERRSPPETAREVLEWSVVPVATKEVAVMRGIDFEDAREELGRIARQEFVGADGFWTLD
ncbi:MAG TPA: DsbA family protein [Solirubrobacterales bacterium]|nr:DsbA family protein [Solirubrobacterales bacterium]